MVEPLWTYRSIKVAVGMFLCLVGVALVWSSRSSSKRESQKQRIFTSPDEIPTSLVGQFDVILVLGGGVPESLEVPPVYVQRRCDDAAAVLERRKAIPISPRIKARKERQSLSLGLPVLCLSAGTAHLPQLLSHDGLPIWESTACSAYLQTHHTTTIPPEDIYVETTSYDTIGNAFYARTSHTEWNGWRRLLIVTNEFHMDRTRAIFDWIFSLPASGDAGSSSRSDQRASTTSAYDLYYLSSPNVGLSQEAIQARMEREKSSEKTVRNVLAPKYTTMSALSYFLTHNHSLYTASKLVERAKPSSDNNSEASDMVKKSYGAASAINEGKD